MPLSPAQIQAIEILAPRKFHQIFTAPATDTRGPLKVSYAIAGIEHGDDVPTILFCGGMFGTRWQAPFSNWQAEKLGVRVLCTDRCATCSRCSNLLFKYSMLLAYTGVPKVFLGAADTSCCPLLSH